MPSRPRARAPLGTGAGVVVGLVIVLGALTAYLLWSKSALSPVVGTVPSVPEISSTAAVNPGYVGPQACAECHADRVAEFRATRHFLANDVPRPGTMPVGFMPGQNSFSVPDLPVRFQMSEADGGYLQTAIRESAVGNETASSTIGFVYGARGGNDEVNFTWHGDRLFELPIVWLDKLGTWGASPFDRHGSGDFSRDMTIRCVECHNTWCEHAPGSRNQYGRDSFILGVTCEVCHGPGREHVAFHQGQPQAKTAHAVVQPARLPRERQMDLCANCHSNALKHRGPAFSYRPGLPLDDFYLTLRTKYPEDDHVANQTTYLRQSRCFQESDTLTCVTCHNPHLPRSATNAGAISCRKCHAAADCTDRDRLPAAVQDDCISCHMPERRKIQVYFRTQTDRYVAPVNRYEHRIAVYPAARQEVLLRWFRTQSDADSIRETATLSRSLAEHWREEMRTRRGDYRFLAAIDAGRESLRFEPGPATDQNVQELIAIQSTIDADLQDALWHEQERRYPQAIEAFQRVLAAKPDAATAHAKLGTTYAVVGQKQLAQEHLQAAARIDPDDPYAPGMLGWLAYLDGHAEEALTYYRQADAVEPYSAKIHYQMGLALVQLGRGPEAIAQFEKAVEIDPSLAPQVRQHLDEMRSHAPKGR
jgi:tetratricopeptide (TPR) repeat protein